MEKITYIFLFIIIILSIINIYFYEAEKELLYLNLTKEKDINFGALAHPINITFDYLYLPENKSYKYLNELIKMLENAKNILSNLILSTNNKYITNGKNISVYYNDKLLNIEKHNIITDIIIIPMIKKFIIRKINITFEADILQEYITKKIPPVGAFLYINDKTNFEQIFNDKNSKQIFLLKSLRALTDCIGLSLKYIIKSKKPKNNFFSTPIYLLTNSYSYKSILKLYNFIEKPIPQHKASINGEFYRGYWDKDSIVKDFRNEEINLNSDLSEVSMNLFNDMDNYLIADCDFHKYYYNNICYRADQKCMSKKEVRSLYLNFGINIEKENEIICYLSNTDNLKNNQCGIKYGHLLQDNVNFCPIFKKLSNKNPGIKEYEIPELKDIKNQTLNLLKPSEKCKNIFPRTIFFNYGNKTDIVKENISTETITFNATDKKYFVTYLTESEHYFNEYIDLFKSNGLIRSYYHNRIHNLFIKNFLEKELMGEIGLNKYQRVFQFSGNNIYYKKDELYSNYLYMKKVFPDSFNYMPLTYIYPKDKEIINVKFTNYEVNISDLWIVKPVDFCSGKGVHLFESLEKENNKKYIISKYIHHPHLIRGRKYDLRLYVLVTGFKPLRIYFNKDGLVRIAASKYSLNKNSINNKYIHLTNTAVNYDSKDYVYPKDVNDENANKWNLNTYKNYLKKQNIDVNSLFNKIKDIIIKAVISGERKIVNKISELNVANQSMFNLFGFDILIDHNSEPILLEINTKPFMYIYDRMDKIIKTNLFIDVLNIIGITPFSHEKNYKSFDRDIFYKNKILENVDYALCEISRPKGDFELIFPLKKNIRYYKKFFLIKPNEENILFWEEILKNE